MGPKKRKQTDSTTKLKTTKARKVVAKKEEQAALIEPHESISNNSNLTASSFDWLTTISAVTDPNDSFLLPIKINILSFLPGKMIGTLSRVSRAWYKVTKTFNWSLREVAIESGDSIYNSAYTTAQIKPKLLAMGFEEELMHFWLRGFDGSVEKTKQFKQILDFSQNAIEELKKSNEHTTRTARDNYAAKRESQVNMLASYIEIDLGDVKFEPDVSKNINLQKLNILSNIFNKGRFAGKQLDYEKIFANTNPVVLFAYIFLQSTPNLAAIRGLFTICKSHSLHMFRLIYEKVKLCYTTKEELQKLNEEFCDLIKTKLTDEEKLKKPFRITEMLLSQYFNVSTKKILSDINQANLEDIEALYKVYSIFQHDKKSDIRNLLNENNIDMLDLVEFSKVELPLPKKEGQKSKAGKSNFLVAMTKYKKLTETLLTQAKTVMAKDIAEQTKDQYHLDWLINFAMLYASAIGFLSQHTKDELELKEAEEISSLFSQAAAKTEKIIIDPKYGKLMRSVFDTKKTDKEKQKKIISTLKRLDEKYPKLFDLLDEARKYAKQYCKAYITQWVEANDTPEKIYEVIQQSCLEKVVAAKVNLSYCARGKSPEACIFFVDDFFKALNEMSNEQGQTLYEFLVNNVANTSALVKSIIYCLYREIDKGKANKFVEWFKENNILDQLIQGTLDLPTITRLLDRFSDTPFQSSPMMMQQIQARALQMITARRLNTNNNVEEDFESYKSILKQTEELLQSSEEQTLSAAQFLPVFQADASQPSSDTMEQNNNNNQGVHREQNSSSDSDMDDEPVKKVPEAKK